MKLSPFFILVFSLINIGLLGNAQAATIFEIQNGVSVYADSVTASSGDYYNQTFTGASDLVNPINSGALAASVTGSNLNNYAWTPNFHLPTTEQAYIDLSFSDDIFNGEGDDLVLFFAGTGTNFQDGHSEGYLFSIDVGIDGILDGENLGVTSSSTSSIYDNDFFASYATIDLGLLGFDPTTPLGDIRIYLGDSSMPALAALGAYHTEAVVVPLPLSSILFGSGLMLLSLFRRKISRG